MTHKDKNPNRLINSTSPYLLQHAYNPVDWYPWGEEALAKAQKEDKPIIVSIGYSACHWCHVMERESFESEAIAKLMNENFVCIKVDREERPDVDAIYMDAVQAMGQRGGWPLNAFLTPDAKPFFAGTYFPPQHWAEILQKVTEAFKNQRQDIEESANSLQQSISTSELQKYGLINIEKDFEEKDLIQMFEKVSKKFDTRLGGMQKAPKFPMPNVYQFLLNYAQVSKNKEALAQVELTLKEMAKGGIYDQIRGGFARYSVDAEWFAPHFEKMLYDNGQLVSLYAEAYNYTKDDFYKEVVYESVEFVERELTSKENGFYSALDADSEGEEGKFYVWQYEELKKIISEKDFDLFADYYQVKKGGNWEHNNNILHKKNESSAFAKKHGLSLKDLKKKVENWKKDLMKVRSKRIRPGLDDKVLTSWNALMLKALVDAYRVFGEKDFLDLALKNAEFIETKLKNGEKLYRTYKDGKANLEAYLEDYALLIEAYIYLYQATFDLKWLKSAENFADYTLKNFYDESENMFFFTDVESEKLIARKKEIFDNVISSSNSVMAKNLHLLGILLDKNNYTEISEKMLGTMKNMVLQDVEYTANWGQLYIWKAYPTAEIVIIGKDYLEFRHEFEQEYLPNKVLIGSKVPSNDLPLLENRPLINNKTSIYVCFNKACQLPVNTVKEALGQL